ncbi:tetratricopeptide repeat protein 12-like [Trichogramma pretiosum]|uniref:tetratricopeptide repeat protein 12-like n=1 Tax=Trichogramma pretiosum TaxID=7493 RepID=UPI0006C98FDD|nr:tetratricopeptide repeat protein 12-like [Trichogramma pretiosum]
MENEGTNDALDAAKSLDLLDKMKGIDRRATEEEFQNFMHRVTEVEKIVKQITSSDEQEQKTGMLLADEILNKNVKTEISEIGELKVKSSRTIINKYKEEKKTDPGQMSQEAFMRGVEEDVKKRAANRKICNERAETYKRIGNSAFKDGNYEKAVTYFTKAVEQRKDSSVLWNNRALCYMKLKLYEKALEDCEWALKCNRANIKALLNSAKCQKLLGDNVKCQEFIELAREKNPHLKNYIADFEKNLVHSSEENIGTGSGENSID